MYDYRKNVCCDGNLHCKPSTDSSTRCCGLHAYQSSTQMCCFCSSSRALSDALALDSKLPDASKADDVAQDLQLQDPFDADDAAQDWLPPEASDSDDVAQNLKLPDPFDADDDAQDSLPPGASDSGDVAKESTLPEVSADDAGEP